MRQAAFKKESISSKPRAGEALHESRLLDPENGVGETCPPPVFSGVQASPALGLQAQLMEAFEANAFGDDQFHDQERYPLAISYGVTFLVCAAFWTALFVAARALMV